MVTPLTTVVFRQTRNVLHACMGINGLVMSLALNKDDEMQYLGAGG